MIIRKFTHLYMVFCKYTIFMKSGFLLLSLLCVQCLFSQLKQKQEGWYKGETKDFTLYRQILEVKEENSFINVQPVKICLFLQGNRYIIQAGTHKIEGTFTVSKSSKAEQKLLLQSYDYGTFELMLSTKKKYAVLFGKGQQPSVKLNKASKKESCD